MFSQYEQTKLKAKCHIATPNATYKVPGTKCLGNFGQCGKFDEAHPLRHVDAE
jgi:hypothetical protein